MNKQLLIITAFLLSFSLTSVFAEENMITNEAYASFYGEPYNGRPTASGEIFDMNAFTAAHKFLPFGTVVEVTNLENGRKVIVRINDRGPFVGNREIDLSRAAAEKLGMIAQGITRVSLRKINTKNNSALSDAGRNYNPPVNDRTENTERTMQPYPQDRYESPVRNNYQPQTENRYDNYNNYSRDTEENFDTYSSYNNFNENTAKKAPAAPVYTPAASEENAGILWRIQLGAFTREENALRLVLQLRDIGFDPAYEKTETHVRVVLYGIRPLDLEKVKNVLSANNFKNYVIRQESW